MDISDSEREFLLGMRALTINDAGEEVYVGLTIDESLTFLGLWRLEEAGELSASDMEKFKTMQAKHETARQSIVNGNAPLYSPSQHHGGE